MSEPYNPPPPPMPPVPPAPPATDPRQTVKGPAIGLIVVAALGAILVLLNLLGALTGSSAFDPQQFTDMMSESMGEEAAAQIAQYAAVGSGPLGVVISLFNLALCGLIGFAGIKMKSLQSRTLGMVACILAMIPCFGLGCCCIFGLPIGIWGLVVLNKPDVRAAFG